MRMLIPSMSSATRDPAPDQNAWRISSYTEPNDIFAVADHTGCTAIHPGYGFFSEDYRFARRW